MNTSHFNGTERAVFLGLLLLALAGLAACDKDSTSASSTGDTNFTINNDTAQLASRLHVRNENVPIEPVPDSNGAAPKRALIGVPVLALSAEIDPPVVGGVTLQATNVDIQGSYVYVSYNQKGSSYVGAVDIIQLRTLLPPLLKSEITFTDADVNALYFDGTTMSLAEASGNASYASPAVLQRIPVSANLLQSGSASSMVLSSYAANSVAVSGITTYITTGSTGGLYVIPGLSGAAQSFFPLDDARWVDYNSSYVAVLQATPNKLNLYDKTTLALVRSISVGGGSIAESKTTVKLVGNKALVASGLGGVKAYNLATGNLVGSIPRPVVSGLDSTLCVANSVAASGIQIFISNGEAGVYLGNSISVLENATGDALLNLTLLGQLKFSNLQSVNHVAYNGVILAVAAGLGGVKLVTVL